MLPFLIVDDNHDILDFLKLELKEVGSLSMQADNCDDAIEILKEVEFEAVFLDIILINESSERILTYLKSDENIKNGNIKIIIMSGAIDENFISKYKDKFFDIIEKPFSNEDFSKVLNKISS